jgi:hypothetical protein
MGNVLGFPKAVNGCRNCNGCWWTDECLYYLDIPPYSMLCCEEQQGDTDAEESALGED